MALMVVFGLTAMIVADIKNPSKGQSEDHLAVMAADMSHALVAGGDVNSVYSNAKSGGALLIKNITAESWTPELTVEYQKKLRESGWATLESKKLREVLLCKNGMLARIDTKPSTDASHGIPRMIYGFSMSYSANSLRTCGS
ncbi:hypothetical protein [Caballeronia sp. LZ001]|uniref:hypothetical protein n=1 Tax=Caballeronia sp. LZ001 TaxID=3038553 RepID=UPI002854735D|nr:hypothetical protein [Caballeronia sp. LZ001]MDR5802254.1 hypothetical protein [Caballeronia sp. LZ001]